jgi:hypothetical protein
MIALVVMILWWYLDGRLLVGYRTQPTPAIAFPIFYFAAMEFIQVAQHSIAAPSLDSAQCDTWSNQVMTMVGAMHIAFQPLALHFGFGRHYRRYLPSSYPMLVRMVALGCLIDAGMMLTGLANGGRGLRAGYDWDSCGAYQWTVGNKLCTYRGTHHLAWSIPFPKPSYYYHGALHSFMFFSPFILAGRFSHFVRGILLFLTGPILAEYLTGWKRHESPSVWCYAFLFNNISVYFWGLIEDLIDLCNWGKTKREVQNGKEENGNIKENGKGKDDAHRGRQDSPRPGKPRPVQEEIVEDNNEVYGPPLVLDWFGKTKTA